MSFNALKFIALTIFAVLLGILSVALSVGGGNSILSFGYLVRPVVVGAVAGTGGSTSETGRALRHIGEN